MLASDGLAAERAVKSMHPLMIEETIRAREEEISKVAENNRLVAIALGARPNLAARIRKALMPLSARSDSRNRSWRRMQPQPEAEVK